MRRIVLVALAAGIGMAAPLAITHAQTTPPGSVPPTAMQGMQPKMNPMMAGMMSKMMSEHGNMMMLKHTEGYLAFLKTELQITDAQSAAWTGYADAARNVAKKAREAMPAMPAMAAMPTPATASGATAMPPMPAMQVSWPDKLAASEKASTAQLDALKTMRPVVTSLYGVLTPEQKKKADELMPNPAGMGMSMGM